MELKYSKELMTGTIYFSGHVTMEDMAELRLDHIDRQVVGSPVMTPADFLQSLEIIFRRAQQQGEKL